MATMAVVSALWGVGYIRLQLDLELVCRPFSRVLQGFQNLWQGRAMNAAGILSSAPQDLISNIAAGDGINHVADHARHSQAVKVWQ
jgi:hypothetical protein